MIFKKFNCKLKYVVMTSTVSFIIRPSSRSKCFSCTIILVHNLFFEGNNILHNNVYMCYFIWASIKELNRKRKITHIYSIAHTARRNANKNYQQHHWNLKSLHSKSQLPFSQHDFKIIILNIKNQYNMCNFSFSIMIDINCIYYSVYF